MSRIAIAAVFLSLSATAALAGGSAAVRFSDLDLSNPRDVQEMGARVHAAAEAACGPVRYTSEGRASMLYDAITAHRDCVRTASDRAMTQVQAVQAAQARANRIASK